jgi:hypothetical protein
MKDYTARSEWQAFMSDPPPLFPANQNQMTATQSKFQKCIASNNPPLPSSTSIRIVPKCPTVNRAGPWVSNQQQQHHNMQLFTLKLAYIPHFQWTATLDYLKQYIASNDQLPVPHSKDLITKLLGQWVNYQKQNYKKRQGVMNHQRIRLQWEVFVSCYAQFFLTNEQQWLVWLDNLKEYMRSSDQLPSQHSSNPSVKQLGQWVSNQRKNYKKQSLVMKGKIIRAHWEAFMSLYPHLFLTTEQQWMKMFEDLKKYIVSNRILPQSNSKDSKAKTLAAWVSRQKIRYKDGSFVMKDEIIRNQWKAFINENPHLFETNERQRVTTLDTMKQYTHPPSGNLLQTNQQIMDGRTGVYQPILPSTITSQVIHLKKDHCF